MLHMLPGEAEKVGNFWCRLPQPQKAYDAVNLTWPPEFDETFAEKTRSLPRRMSEVLFYHESQHRDTPGEIVVDLNYSMNWGAASYGKCPCIVSTSMLWCLRRNGGQEILPEEALCLQGFSHSAMRPQAFSGRQVYDLAGNAFNGGVLAAVISACFASCDWAECLDVLAGCGCDDQGVEGSESGETEDVDSLLMSTQEM